jgi:hypothetical protein
MPAYSKQAVPIYGAVGFLQFSVKIDGEENSDDFLYGYARETHRELEGEIRQQVKETLGSDFEVLEVRLDRGSVAILVVVGAVGTFYMGFSRYESFIKSVNLLVSQLKGVFRRFFERVNPGPPDIDLSVTGSWQPSATVLNAREKLESSASFDYGIALLVYLLLSHAALLGTLVWLLIRHLK